MNESITRTATAPTNLRVELTTDVLSKKSAARFMRTSVSGLKVLRGGDSTTVTIAEHSDSGLPPVVIRYWIRRAAASCLDHGDNFAEVVRTMDTGGHYREYLRDDGAEI